MLTALFFRSSFCCIGRIYNFPLLMLDFILLTSNPPTPGGIVSSLLVDLGTKRNSIPPIVSKGG